MEHNNYLMDIEHFDDCLSLCIDAIDCQQCYFYHNTDLHIESNTQSFINWFDLLVNFFYFSGILLGSIGIGCFLACVFVGRAIYKPIKRGFRDDDFEDYLDYEEKYDKEHQQSSTNIAETSTAIAQNSTNEHKPHKKYGCEFCDCQLKTKANLTRHQKYYCKSYIPPTDMMLCMKK